MLRSPLDGAVSGPAKLQAVKCLLGKLAEDLRSSNLSPHERDAALEELKVHGRDPRDAEPIFTREAIETLTKHAFDSPSETTCHNALRCLCNAMFLKPETRQFFVDLGYEAKACARLMNDSRDDEFLASRIIFLTTYGTSISLAALIDEHHLAGGIVKNLARHAGQCSGTASGTDKISGTALTGDMALAETLKLLFNVTTHVPQRAGSFAPAIPHIITLLANRDVPALNDPLAPPMGLLINALMNLQLGSDLAKSVLFPEGGPIHVIEKLVYLLEVSVSAYGDHDLEQTVTPLVSVLDSAYEQAPDTVKKYIRGRLLPTEEDRQQVLGRGTTVSSHLLRNMTNPMTPEFRKAVSHLLFDLSGREASEFIDNVGYGYASGFLFQNNIPIPAATQREAAAGAGGVAGETRRVNPITGQFTDAERFPELPEMTQEEKEREAERLFVLFERLKKNGIMNVQNPVEQAFREGRVQELDDDSD